jgi:exportin-2 (importin alpha re-exporter)
VQAGVFGMVCERLLIPEVQKVSGNVERKICAVGMTRLLCETPALLGGSYSRFWAPLLQALIGLFELPEDESVPDDEHFIEIEDTPGYQTAYSQLAFAGQRPTDDPAANVADARANLAQSLHKLSVGHPGMVGPLVASIDPQAKGHLDRYLQSAGVSL